MELTTISSNLLRTKHSFLLLTLATFFCIFTIGFLAFASVILIFVILPFALVFGTPLRLLFFVWQKISYFITISTDYFSPFNSPKELSRSRSRSRRRLLSAPGLLTPTPKFKELQLADSPSHSQVIFRPSSTYNTASEHVLSRFSESETLDQIRSGLSISTGINTSPNVLGVSLFVDSPVDYRQMNLRDNRKQDLQSLPFAIVEEILKYLPSRSLSSLALISKNFGRKIRFYRVHSGTEYVALQTFTLLARQPQSGKYVRQLVVHHTFYRPHIKAQWLLEGSDPHVAHSHWTATEGKKIAILSAVLDSCEDISSLSWSEGRLPLPPRILNMVEARLSSTIRQLDIYAESHQLLMHLPQMISQQADSLRLELVTVRGGFTSKSLVDISTLLLMTKRTLRHLRFVDTRFGNSLIRLSESLHELTSLTLLEFINPTDLDGKHIPVAFLGQQSSSGCGLVISNPVSTSNSLQIMFSVPPLQVLSNLDSLIITIATYEMIGERLDPTLPSTRSALHEIVAAAIKLRVFACNSPIADGRRNYYDPHMNHGIPPLVSYELIDALCTKQNLISLSLMSWMLSPKQLRLLSDNLPQLRHLGVYMQGEARDISKYSPSFFKLKYLMVLDVAISPFDPTCPCGHDLDPRIPHTREGTAMGRLSQRINIKQRKDHTELQLVRLSQNGWFPEPAPFNTRWNYELHWVEPEDVAQTHLEQVCGPCHDKEEVIRKIFRPISWIGYDPN
ncbi:hypothetical protein M422DRAFT_773866 [Sphaerobolus stellatus SS14]|nr:hypothetical protein M422DRAFT_773866 [Sphaerobolus stellatus SS14]